MNCPECLGKNSVRDNICKLCGYKMGHAINNHRCAYEDGGQHCPLMGTHTEATKPNDTTRWYCLYHKSFYEDPKAASQALSAILNGDIQPPVNWRKQALHEAGVKLKKSNPEIFVTEAASKDIAEVNLSLIRDLQSRMPKLPYNPQKLIAGKSFAEDEILTGNVIDNER